MRDLRGVLQILMAVGALAGAFATLAVAEPSLERSAAFWVLFLIFAALFVHISASIWTPPFTSVKVVVRRQMTLRKHKRALSDWLIHWFQLDPLLRNAVKAAASRRVTDEDWRKNEQEYLKLRRYFQQHQWPFMPGLTARLHGSLKEVPEPPTDMSGFHTHLERELWGSRTPFRLFYAQPDLREEVGGLAPDAVDRSQVDHGTHVRGFDDAMDRIEDIIREFATELSVDVTRIVDRR
jgi:hypothetical protein